METRHFCKHILRKIYIIHTLKIDLGGISLLLKKEVQQMDKKLGHYAFVVAIILAIIAGLVPSMQTNTVTWTLIILGLVVGLLNISAKETTEFLVAVIALMLVGSAGLGEIAALGASIKAILLNITAIAVPAALVVSLKAIYTLADK
jgi:hypothetical protein